MMNHSMQDFFSRKIKTNLIQFHQKLVQRLEGTNVELKRFCCKFSKTKNSLILGEFMPRDHRAIQKQSVCQIGYAVLYVTYDAILRLLMLHQQSERL